LELLMAQDRPGAVRLGSGAQKRPAIFRLSSKAASEAWREEGDLCHCGVHSPRRLLHAAGWNLLPDLGPDHFQAISPQSKAQQLVRQIERLGFTCQIASNTEAEAVSV
jgi:hypothetical protein